MRWPWRRRSDKPIPTGEVAAEAKRQAERKLEQQRRQWPEVVKARDQFADAVERALRGQP